MSSVLILHQQCSSTLKSTEKCWCQGYQTCYAKFPYFPYIHQFFDFRPFSPYFSAIYDLWICWLSFWASKFVKFSPFFPFLHWFTDIFPFFPFLKWASKIGVFWPKNHRSGPPSPMDWRAKKIFAYMLVNRQNFVTRPPGRAQNFM